MTLVHLPIAAINADALPRDRSTTDPAAMEALVNAIAATGLRQPVEVWALADPEPPHTHGLISGHRRLAACRRLHDLREGRDFTHIAAFLRTPTSLADAMALMIAENEVRADISPWEKGRILLDAVTEGIFDTLDGAVRGLHPHLNDMARSRLRTLATVAQTFNGHLTAPETLSQRQLLRMAAAIRAEFVPLILAALSESTDTTPERQWRLIERVVAEAEDWLKNPDPIIRPGRPLRLLRPRPGLTVRREKTPEGWSIHFTGPEAHGALLHKSANGRTAPSPGQTYPATFVTGMPSAV